MNINSLKLKEKLEINTDRERQIPNSLENVEITHKIRYEFIKNYLINNNIQNSFILDYGCGSGYGVKILSKICKKIIGVDNNKKILIYADKIFGGKNINYYLNYEKFDFKLQIVTCIEMIEHISSNEANDLLKKFYNLLDDEGILFLSTPRKPYGNPYHIYEYTYDEMVEILTKIGFKNIESYGQVYDKIDFHKNLLDYYKNRDKYTMLFICKK